MNHEIEKPQECYLKSWVAQAIGQRSLFLGDLMWNNNQMRYLQISNTVTKLALKNQPAEKPRSVRAPIRINMSKHITDSGR